MGKFIDRIQDEAVRKEAVELERVFAKAGMGDSIDSAYEYWEKEFVFEITDEELEYLTSRSYSESHELVYGS